MNKRDEPKNDNKRDTKEPEEDRRVQRDGPFNKPPHTRSGGHYRDDSSHG